MNQVCFIIRPLSGELSSLNIWSLYYKQLLQSLKGIDVRLYFDRDHKTDGTQIIGIGTLSQLPCIEKKVYSIVKNAQFIKTELWDQSQLSDFWMSRFILEMKENTRLVVGSAEAERMLQRGKLTMLIVASDVDKEHLQMVEKFLNTLSTEELTVYRSKFSRKELGEKVGVHRASLVGIIKPSRTFHLT